jgi:membrane-associated phospholipid phosphatase
MQTLSTLANIGFIAPLFAAVLCLLLARRDYLVAATWGGGVLLSLLIALSIKWMLRLDTDLPHFPSGHVSLAVAFYGGLLVIFLSGRGDRPVGMPMVVLLLGCVALAEGWSRVTLTEHTWVDVAGGFVVGLGGLMATGCPWTYARVRAKRRIWLAATILVAAPFAFFSNMWLDGLIRHVIAL